jgi:hypothetical protein
VVDGLDANMICFALLSLRLPGLGLLVLENMGNLVCAAEFRVGEDARGDRLGVTGVERVLVSARSGEGRGLASLAGAACRVRRRAGGGPGSPCLWCGGGAHGREGGARRWGSGVVSRRSGTAIRGAASLP